MVKNLSLQVAENPVCLIPDIVYSQPPAYFGYTSRALKMHFVRLAEDGLGAQEKTKRPTIVWIIGGAFKEIAPLKFAPEFAYLAKEGYHVALIEYRVSNEAVFPAAVQDAKAAIRFLRAHADKYGIDENRIAVMGDSAGGYLAAMVGATTGMKEFETDEWEGYDSSVRAVIDLYGPTDLEAMVKDPDNRYFGDNFKPEVQFLGPSATHGTWRLANPISHITRETPPYLIFHGTADEMVPDSQSRLLYEALEKKGVPADLYLLEGVYHARHEFWQPEIKEIILDFLRRYL